CDLRRLGPRGRRRLGGILGQDHRVRPEDVESALCAARPGDRLGTMLLRMGAVSDRELAAALGHQLGTPVLIGLTRLEIPDAVLALVPHRYAEKKLVIPVELVAGTPARLLLAMADPTDREVVRSLAGIGGFAIMAAISTEEEIRRALKVFYLGERM